MLFIVLFFKGACCYIICRYSDGASSHSETRFHVDPPPPTPARFASLPTTGSVIIETSALQSILQVILIPSVLEVFHSRSAYFSPIPLLTFLFISVYSIMPSKFAIVISYWETLHTTCQVQLLKFVLICPVCRNLTNVKIWLVRKSWEKFPKFSGQEKVYIVTFNRWFYR